MRRAAQLAPVSSLLDLLHSSISHLVFTDARQFCTSGRSRGQDGTAGGQSLRDLMKKCRNGQFDDALASLDTICKAGMEVPMHIFSGLLRLCIQKQDLAAARRVYALIFSSRYQASGVLNGHLIRMFGSCGSLQDAAQVFRNVLKPCVHTWQAIISAHVKFGEGERAIELYHKMRNSGIEPNDHIYCAVLQACATVSAGRHGREIHKYMIHNRCKYSVFVGNTLIDMYAKCGDIEEARKVFDGLLQRDVVSWNVLIAGYVEHGMGEVALALYEDMQRQGLMPDRATFLCVLKSCGVVKALDKGMQIHTQILDRGLAQDTFVATTLVDMYAKCGNLGEARKVFDGMSRRSVVSWTAMIAGCVEHGLGQEALALYEDMQRDGVVPNKVTLVCILKACAIIKELDAGTRIHSYIFRCGLAQDAIVGSSLVDMYAKCGNLQEARKVFDGLLKRDVVTWNAMAVGYAEHGLGEEALTLYGLMQHEGPMPDCVTFACALKACAIMGALDEGMLIHNQILKCGLLAEDVFLGNTLVDMYIKCANLEEAQKVFNRLPHQAVGTWNSMIAGYAEHGQGDKALALYADMQREGVMPNNVTFIFLLKACAGMKALDEGKKIHHHIVNHGLAQDAYVGSTLVDMYAKCGYLEEALKVFQTLSLRDVVTWNAMIAGYTENGLGQKALDLFEDIQHQGLIPDRVTFLCLLKACASVGTLGKGMQIHGQILNFGLGNDLIIGNALVDMYAKCGNLGEARRVFDGLSRRDVVSWTAIMGACAEHGLGKEALSLYDEMQYDNVMPNNVTFVCLLKACASTKALEQGIRIHEQISDCGLLEDVAVGNTLVDMFAKCGNLQKALEIFNGLPSRNVVAWNAMIAGYAEHGFGSEALGLYKNMQTLHGLVPDRVTFLTVLKACTSIGALDEGVQMHNEILNSCLAQDVFIGNSLVAMYAKCGNLQEARKVFDGLLQRDVVSWTAMIAGYAEHGLGKEALALYEDMQLQGVMPNCVTFICLLTACSHAGLVNEGTQLFSSMSERFGITPDIEHYTCIVDLFGRAGFLEEAESIINSLQIPHTDLLWMCVLGACRRYGNVELGSRAFDSIMKLNPGNTAAYVLLSDIYDAAGRWDDQAEVRKKMRSAGIEKVPGRSWIEVGKEVHTFVADDADHPERRKIYAKLSDFS